MALYCAQQEHGSVMLHNFLQSQSRGLCTILSGHIWRFLQKYALQYDYFKAFLRMDKRSKLWQ
jgi:hypothetical protein